MPYRADKEAVIAGVASGIAKKYNYSIFAVRGLFVLSFFALGLGLVVYLLLWSRMPARTGQVNLIKK